MKLNNRSIEMQNRLNLINVAFEDGYVAYLPVVDEGIDLILYRKKDQDIIKVQLKSRWTINKKYVGHDICIAFPEGKKWYLAPHDAMVKIAEDLKFAVGTQSWNRDDGEYHIKSMGKKLGKAMQNYLFPSPPKTPSGTARSN